MTDTPAAADAPAKEGRPGVPPMLLEMMKKRGLRDWDLTVTGASQVTPRMRRVSLTAANLGEFGPKPGQDMVLMLPDGEGGLGRRHYSVRRFDAASKALDIDVVLHGDSTPGTRFALDAKPGDGILGFGPRGRNVIHPDADWRLFVSDETGLPPIFAMLETLPAGAKAFAIIEVADEGDRQPLQSAADVQIQWVSRGGAHADAMSPALIQALADFEFPAGLGHVYLLGETSTIRRQRHDIIARGMPKAQIFGEGYWRPGRLGGHDHLEEH